MVLPDLPPNERMQEQLSPSANDEGLTQGISPTSLPGAGCLALLAHEVPSLPTPSLLTSQASQPSLKRLFSPKGPAQWARKRLEQEPRAVQRSVP
eukprot:1659352-Rhodomonas_salina.3